MIYLLTYAHFYRNYIPSFEAESCTMSSGTLFVKDSRTNVQYEVPIKRNAILATDIKKIKGSPVNSDRADQVAGGLRVHDPGLQNTTVVESAISFSYV